MLHRLAVIVCVSALNAFVAHAQLAITTVSLPQATAGTPYNATLSATGGTLPYTWSNPDGGLPQGLMFNPGSPTATISGTPAMLPAGGGVIDPLAIRFQVMDSQGLTATVILAFIVTNPLVITTLALPQGSIGTSYFYCLTAAGGTLASGEFWAITGGSPPTGLSLGSNSTCPGYGPAPSAAIFGTPTQAGSFPITFQAGDSQGRSAQQSYTLTINPVGLPAQSLILTPSSLTFLAQPNGQAPPTQTVGVNLTSGSLGFTAAVTQGASWLSVNPGASTTSAALTVSVSLAALSPGPYSGTIQIVAPGSPNSPQNLGVTLGTNVTSSTANGIYKAGSTISIQVSFAGPVTVTGTPQLALNSGGTANYVSGSGTPTLTFAYIVGASDSSAHLDYTSTGALTLNGGTISANLTLAEPGAAGSLGANSNILIGAAPPAPFFTGEAALSGGEFYLQFPSGNVFGYYSFQFYPILYHDGLGYESFLDAHDGNAGAYFYDFASGHWWYTSPSVFPDLYDFTLSAWLYYFANTTNPRYFANLSTQKIFTL
jgi:hypothetical protein